MKYTHLSEDKMAYLANDPFIMNNDDATDENRWMENIERNAPSITQTAENFVGALLDGYKENQSKS